VRSLSAHIKRSERVTEGATALKSFEIWLVIIHATRSDTRRRLTLDSINFTELEDGDDSIH